MNEKSEFVNIISDKSEYIKKVRNELRYKQEYMAAEMGISQSKYSMYEKFADYLDPVILKKIAQILDIDFKSLESYIKYDITEQFSEPDIEFLRNISAEIIFEAMENEKMDLLHKISLGTPLFKNVLWEEKDKIDIEMYLDGQLEGLQLEEAEKRLKKDKAFRDSLAMSKEVNENLNVVFLKETLNEVCTEQEKTRQVALKHKKWLIAASISIMLLLGGSVSYTIINRDSLENRLYSKYYEPYTLNKREFVLNSSALYEAQRRYLNGDYRTSLSLYKNLPSSITIESEREFFIALTLIELQQYNEAIVHFKNVISNKDYPEYRSKVKWYMALCSLKTNNIKDAIDLLQSIVDNNEYNYKKARKILRKLKD